MVIPILFYQKLLWYDGYLNGISSNYGFTKIISHMRAVVSMAPLKLARMQHYCSLLCYPCYSIMVSLSLTIIRVVSLFHLIVKSIIVRSALLKDIVYLIAGRKDSGGSDLRDTIDRRYSPKRRYSPARDARGRHTLHGQDLYHFPYLATYEQSLSVSSYRCYGTYLDL